MASAFAPSLPESWTWQAVDDLLDELIRLDSPERTTRLDELKQHSPEVFPVLKRLLAGADSEQDLNDVLVRVLSHLADDKTLPAQCQLGPWRLLSLIGHGGMARVFLAERADGAYRQQVALKLLWPGLSSGNVLARFDQERQILAALDDPRLARLIDGGISDDGCPWLAMELVEGLPVDRYCDENRLSVKARLRLFVEIAAAVSAAHRRLVVHRDLKPANVMVTADGRVKLLDFGIAKLLDADVMVGAAPATRRAERLLTPEYASPEQLTEQPVTTASDVYQLGALLFELLAGQPPHQRSGLTASEFEQRILEGDAPRPSARVRALDADRAAAVAQARATNRKRLIADLRGDLDAVVGCAMATDPEARYASADAMLQDVKRLLHGWPVVARVPRRWYRLGKFVGRHRTGVALSLLGILAILAGLAGTSWQTQIAAAEARKAEEVKQFLVDIFEINAPDAAQGAQVTARELLDRSAERIRGELAGQPGVQSELMAILGDTYRRLALFEQAEPMLETALQMRLQLYGPGHQHVAESRYLLGTLYRHQGRFDLAEEFLDQALEIRRARLGRQHPLVADTLLGLLELRRAQGRHPEAEPLAQEALAIYRQAYPDWDPRVVRAERAVAVTLHNRGEIEQAEQLYLKGIETLRAHHGDVHTEIASSLHNLGFIAMRNNEYARAESLLREALEIKHQIYGQEHSELVTTLAALGHTLEQQGDLAGAEGLYRQALTMLRQTALPSHPRIASGLHSLGSVLLQQQRPDEAEPLLRESLDIRRQVLGPEHRQTLATEQLVVEVQIALGEMEVADSLQPVTADQ